jgi:cobalt/nickel transport system ATP-binding protein
MFAGAGIHVQELGFAYPSGVRALDRLCFEVAAGESVGLVGPNGAGKTTLFLCMSGVLTPTSGKLCIDGLNPADASDRKALPAKVGIVFQESDDQLFSSTVFDDVAFGPLNLALDADEVRRRVSDSLARVNLSGFEERVPYHLSGGEKRRVALAGVLAMHPQVLLLDEPSIHLDPRGRREFIKVVNSLDVTKIVAAHDLELILATCRRVLVLDEGRIIADGAARTVLGDSALMEGHGLEVPHSLMYHHPSARHHDTETG